MEYMKLEIRKNPDPILRKGTAKVKDPLAKDVQELALNMLEMTHTIKGVGLAAPQVGSNLRLCIVSVDGDEFIMFNPQITAKSKDKVLSEEGCFSFPGQYFPVLRYREVQVRYIDQFGNQKKVRGKDLLAFTLQHEIDHLDGVLFIDRVPKKFLKNIQSNIKK